MASPLPKPIASIPGAAPTVSGVGGQFKKETGTVRDALLSSLRASEMTGTGLRAIMNEIEKMAERMTAMTATKALTNRQIRGIINDEMENAALEEAEKALVDSAANDNTEQNISGESPVATNDGQNLDGIDPAEAIEAFGTDPLGEDAANDDTEPETQEQDEEAPVGENTEKSPEPENKIPQNRNPQGNRPPNQTDNNTAPGNENSDQENNQDETGTKPTDSAGEQKSDQEGEQKNDKQENEDDEANPDEIPNEEKNSGDNTNNKRMEEGREQAEKTREEEKNKNNNESAEPNSNRENPENQEKSSEPESAEKEEEKSEPESEPESPAPQPEENPMNKEEGEPFVKTNESGQPLEQKTPGHGTAAGAEENSQPPEAGENGQSPEAESEETSTAQNPQERGILLQNFNKRRNKPIIDEIEKEINQLNENKKKIQKEIKSLDDFLKPMERKRMILNVASWTLLAIEILIKTLAIILAITIIFLFIIPIAPMVWTASNIPNVARELIDIKIRDLDKKIKTKKEERESKLKKIKSINQQIAKLAHKRFKIINESLLQTLKQQSSNRSAA